MRLNGNGQVTIPADLRARYNLREGDELDVIDEGGVLRIVVRTGDDSPGERMVEHLRRHRFTNPDIVGLSTDEIMALLRD
ncbi:AbrB/MazE/SpoVT family DNA-binding domain-containing protein [Nocardia sp. NPDC019395]|uniref:AbrB/MazE/SpoVT family DNA-binding domain-containing protein n=1 Tax=Nocardia sp. NPDC019395 TaxID=3154686 RepID=UPI0033FF0A8B